MSGTAGCSSALPLMDPKSREFISHPLCQETDLRSRSRGAGGDGAQRTFSIVWNWDERALGAAQVLNPVRWVCSQEWNSAWLFPGADGFLQQGCLPPLEGRVGMLLWVLVLPVLPAHEDSWEQHQEQLLPAERSLPGTRTRREGGGSRAAPGRWFSCTSGPGRGSCERGWASGAQKWGEMFRETFEMSDVARLISKWNHNHLWSLNFVTVALFLPFYLCHVKQFFWQHHLHINFVTWCLPLSGIWSEYPIILFGKSSQEFRLFKATNLPQKLNFSAQA